MSNQTVDGLLKKKIARAHRKKVLRGVLLILLVAAVVLGVIYAVRGVLGKGVSTAHEPKAAATAEASSGSTKQELTAETAEPSKGANTAKPTESTGDIKHTVQITWVGAYEPPESVKINVLHGTEVVDSFDVTKENGWSHIWSDSYNAGVLKLVGTFPRNVSAVLSVSGENFIVTGTCEEPESTDYVPEGGVEETVMVEGELPQTGLVWIPVLLMMFAGIWLIFSGTADIVERRKTRK